MRYLRLIHCFLVAAISFLMVCGTASAAKHALVIGNANYQRTIPLLTPVNDAKAVAESLSSMGFNVTLGTDLDYRGFQNIVRKFAENSKEAEIAILFYAGHALNVKGENHLLPVDARLTQQGDIDYETIPLSFIIKTFERDQRTNLFLLDAGRPNPFAEHLIRRPDSIPFVVVRSLASVEIGIDSTVVLSTAPGDVASEGSGRFSPFTKALLKHIDGENLELHLLIKHVRREVAEMTDGQQLPWYNSSLRGDVYLKGDGASLSASQSADPVVSEAPNRKGDAETAEKSKVVEVNWKKSTVDTDFETTSTVYVREHPGTHIKHEFTLDAGERVHVISRWTNPESSETWLQISYREKLYFAFASGFSPVVAKSDPDVNLLSSRGQPKPNLIALIVGVSQYEDSSLSLNYASKDAQDIASLIVGQKDGLYGEVEIRLLADQDATEDAIQDGLTWFEHAVTDKDVGMVFFAGHGFTDRRNRFYFLPHDGDPDRLRATGISQSTIQTTLSDMPGKIMLFIDACHAGGGLERVLSRGASKLANANLEHLVEELRQTSNGMLMFASSTAGQVSEERHEWENGAFTEALIEGLNGEANYNGDKAITVKELDFWLTNRVKQLTNGNQQPITRLPDTIPDFPFALTGDR